MIPAIFFFLVCVFELLFIIYLGFRSYESAALLEKVCLHNRALRKQNELLTITLKRLKEGKV